MSAAAEHTMDLLLWRHAEAAPAQPGQSDLERALTARGQGQAARIGNWLERHLPKDARLLCSPALRTRQTVQALARPAKIEAALAPECDSDDLLKVVGWPQAAGCVVVVGHQPILGQTLARLLGLQGQELAVKKGAVWWLRTRQRYGAPETVLLTVQHPDLL